MGKAIRNFKDALSGVEEAKFRKMEGSPDKVELPPQTAQSAPTAPSQSSSVLPGQLSGQNSAENLVNASSKNHSEHSSGLQSHSS